MKKYLSLILALVCTFALCACGKEEAAEHGLTKEDVCGVWIEDMGDGIQTLTLNEDMTYHKNIVLYDPYLETNSEDTFKLEGDTLTMNYSAFGTESKYTVTFEGDTMIWDNGRAQIVYTREK